MGVKRAAGRLSPAAATSHQVTRARMHGSAGRSRALSRKSSHIPCYLAFDRCCRRSFASFRVCATGNYCSNANCCCLVRRIVEARNLQEDVSRQTGRHGLDRVRDHRAGKNELTHLLPRLHLTGETRTVVLMTTLHSITIFNVLLN